jgi:uncharacterized membrane protein YgcG
MATFESDRVGSRVKAFSGEAKEWFVWKPKFQALLFSSGGDLLGPLSQERPSGVNAGRAWDKKSAAIYWKLVLHTDGAANGLVEQFGEEQDGVGAWEALVTKYEPTGTIGKVTLHAELMQSSLGVKEDPDAFFVRIELLQRRLRAMGRNVDDEELLGIVLARLPPTYTNLRIVLDTDDNLTYETLKRKMRIFYKRETVDSRAESGETALTARINGKCFSCGDYGHPKWDCPKKKQAPGNGGRSDGSSGGGGGRGGGGRGRGAGEASNDVTCFRCGKQGHKYYKCKARVIEAAATAEEREDEDLKF